MYKLWYNFRARGVCRWITGYSWQTRKPNKNNKQGSWWGQKAPLYLRSKSISVLKFEVEKASDEIK